MRRVICVLPLLLVGGCATFGSPREDAVRGAATDWMAYGAMVRELGPAELEGMRGAALAADAASPSADSAIRLAILETARRTAAADFERAVGWLDAAASASDADVDDLAFVRFFRPVVVQLQAQRDALDAALAESAGLSERLNALRQLEEQIDVGE